MEFGKVTIVINGGTQQRVFQRVRIVEAWVDSTGQTPLYYIRTIEGTYEVTSTSYDQIVGGWLQPGTFTG